MSADRDDAGFGYAGPDTTRRATASGFLLDAARFRPLGRYVLSGLVALLFISGGGLFAYPFFTDVYTEQVIQERLDTQFRNLDARSPGEWRETVAQQEQGSALTRIAIPALGVETLVVQGTSPEALRAGAGHYPNTPLPGQPGNVAIAGHRTTYGAPFNRMDELRTGDDVWLQTPVGDYRYEVITPPDGLERGRVIHDAVYITDPRDWEVIEPTERPSLTLTSCHPKGSAAQRIVVRAVLRASEPPGTYAEQASDAPQALAR